MTELIPNNWKSSINRWREHANSAVDHWLSKFKRREPKQPGSRQRILLDSLGHGLELDEGDDEFIARFALPGPGEKDFQVEVAEDRLVIRSGKNLSSKGNGPGYFRYQEISTSFAWAVSLPCEIDRNRVKAKYKNGLLTVSLPKSEGPRSKRLKMRAA